jgi:H+/Cl- antiporter ClcA
MRQAQGLGRLILATIAIGVLVGVAAIYYPQVMPAGYPVIIKALHGGLDTKLLVLLLLLAVPQPVLPGIV